MIPLLGLIGVSLGIWALFWFDRDEAPISNAIWVPFAWLLIGCSRPVSSWLSFSVPDAGEQYVDGSPLDRNILIFFLILALIALSKRMKHVRGILRANVPLIAFLTYCLISILWSDYPFVVLKRWIRSVGDVAMIMVIVTEPGGIDALKRVLMRIGFLLVPLSILFIRFYPSLGRTYSAGGAPMWTGVATDKNALGALCMLVGVVALWQGIKAYQNRADRFRKNRLISTGILFGLSVYVLLVANSQTALSCFLMADTLIILTAVTPLFRKPAIVSLVVAAMLTVSFCVLFLGIGGGALTTLGRNATLTGRTEVWQIVLPFAKNAWIGAGYENFWIGERLRAIERALGTGLNQAHNGYIEVYLNIGWIGLMLLGTIIITGYRNVMRGMRNNPETGRLKLAFFVICLIYNFTEAAFKMMSPVWILFLWAAMANPMRYAVDVQQRSPVAARPRWFLAEDSTTGELLIPDSV